MANAWARRTEEGESQAAHKAFMDYCVMPVPRSIRDLHASYLKHISSGIQANKPPTDKISTLFTWSDRNEWVVRASAYDAEQQRIDDELRKEERAKIMAHRYANDYERVRALDEISANLLEMTKDEAKVWLPDIKVVGFGKEQQTVDIVRFNAPLFDQLRGSLMDIARHKGELVQKTDVTSNGETVKGYIGVDTDKV